MLALKTQKAGERIVALMLGLMKAGIVLGTGGQVAAMALKASLRNAGLKETSISVTGRAAVGDIETGENLVQNCVYDSVL